MTAGAPTCRALRCEHLVDPIGLDPRTTQPRLTWVVDDHRRDARHTAVEVVAATAAGLLDESSADLWRSGRLAGPLVSVRYDGGPVALGATAWWQVRAVDAGGVPGPWSEPARWEHGPADLAGRASWIAGPARPSPEPGTGRPADHLRQTFEVPAGVVRARLHVTALGHVDAHINGERVGHDRFTPGWTDYRRRVRVVTHDVTDLVRCGANAIGLTLADGWYAGWIGWLGGREWWGDRPAALAVLEVTLDDGTRLEIATDGEWRTALGAIQSTDMLMGERHDARRHPHGWATAAFDGSSWLPVDAVTPEHGELVGLVTPLPRAVEARRPIAVHEPEPGVHVFDVGENIVGWARLRVRPGTVPAGTAVRLRFAEVLDDDGGLDTRNLRSARATDEYVVAGTGDVEVWEPSFTFHGFRYVEVTGLPAPPLETITAIVCHSPMDRAGSFACSDDLVNRLHGNAERGLLGNVLEVPTDCPQRDERLGWMGDAQAFAPTAMGIRDATSFYSKWLWDVIDGQRDDGAFPDVAPHVVLEERGAPGWADAGVLVPWLLYERSGDETILERCFPAMVRWVDYVHGHNPDGVWRNKRGYDNGDWLSIDADTPKDLISTAYAAWSAELTARAARALGSDEAARLDGIAATWRRGFQREYVDDDGRVTGDTQAGMAVALRFGLVPEELRSATVEHLAADVAARGDHLSTGFLGVAHLLPALTEAGRGDVAHRLLHQPTYPGWMHAVRHGATTIWERWNGWTEEHGYFEPGMNSFNHYAFGAVGEWLYESVAGLRPVEPGYARVAVAPVPGDLRWARYVFDSVRGRFDVAWEQGAGRFVLDVTVPCSVTADVVLPVAAGARVRVIERGEPVSVDVVDGWATVGAGRWRFAATWT